MGESVKRETEIAASKKIADVLAEERAAEKKQIRMEALARRDDLTAEQRRDYSDRIVKKLTSLPCYQNAEAVLTYVSFRSEVDTFPLMERAFADGKAVFAPKVLGKEMAFYRISSADDLSAGYRGILEPSGGQLFDAWMSSVLVCMPGAAFDRERHRIGYGGGFYDRFLGEVLRNIEKTAETDQPQMRFTTAALAFDCQIFDKLPWGAHDICPMYLITEKEVIGSLIKH